MTDGHHQNQVEEVRNALQEFLANNPASTVGENSSVNTPCVLNPWGDDSIVFSVTSKDAALIEVINSVTLPERYSAIWHHKTKRLEIIFTAYPLTGALADVIGRSFEFIHKERVYGCSYNSPSDELLLIADSMIPVGPPSSSSYRSMGSFRTFMMSRRKDAEEEIKQYFSTVNPICFWIDGIEWDENEVLDLANHLNFYMFYYDTASPRINIHSPQSENVAKQPQTRYTLGKFPSTISSISIDDNLLHFWHASRIGDPARRFLYNYQIIEHSAFFHVDDGISKSVRKALSMPHAKSDITFLTNQIIEIMNENRLEDHLKIERIIGKVMECGLIWREIALNIEVFSKQMVFDGGFTVEPLVRSGGSLAEFSNSWKTSVPGTLRKIRNALSHAKELRMSSSILPTADNLARLQYWVPLVEVCAREVMVYRTIV